MKSRLRRETEPGGEGERLGADGWTARGVYSDGPRRLTRRPEASEVEIFPLGTYEAAQIRSQRYNIARAKARLTKETGKRKTRFIL